MPKIGQEPIRRAALVAATVDVIGEAGSLDVTVGQIARRAGMSSALAHHYFGGKAQIFLAAMRHILTEYALEVRTALADAPPEQRLEAIVRANFAESCFRPPAISAWLNFYVLAQSDAEASRLLSVYQSRLRSNLTHALRGRCKDPEQVAECLSALIDGVYLRAALAGQGVGGAADRVLQAAYAMMETPE
ncbi:choline-responsive transcriptional repressor BetI [Pacificoceanicola onchidii]|uniref:choline-binding transcriptional repressor BetI n=1 Tax=Pacificoceanicola onchidii TaxID=2562685 RepID=UPI0010A5C8CC|nr:transcriptional regulator BetI [Pacificoceanicola onchidii]